MDRTPAPTVIVLASGRGERFVASGGQGSKLQALLGGRPVLDRTLDAVRASGLPFHVEDAGHPGMGDSIAAAVRATRDAAGWLILPGDLPLVEPGTLQAVARALSSGGSEVVVPVHRGQRGHPVGFSRACGASLAALAGPQGAASVVKAHRARELEVDDEGVVVDVDTVEALAKAERLWRQRRDAEVLARIDAAFGSSPRPEHFTNFRHCCECAEHDELLRSRDRETLRHADVGNPGWDPICFTSPEGFAYYFPALARLALSEPSPEHGWYAEQLLFHLSSGFRDNAYFNHCNAAQRGAVAHFLAHVIETRAALIDDYAATDEFLRCHELWSGA